MIGLILLLFSIWIKLAYRVRAKSCTNCTAWSGLLASFVVMSIINSPHCAHYRCSHRLCCFILPWRAQQCFFLSQHALCYFSSRAVFQAPLSPCRGAGSGAWFDFWYQWDCWERWCRSSSPSEPDDTLKATHCTQHLSTSRRPAGRQPHVLPGRGSAQPRLWAEWQHMDGRLCFKL